MESPLSLPSFDFQQCPLSSGPTPPCPQLQPNQVRHILMFEVLQISGGRGGGRGAVSQKKKKDRPAQPHQALWRGGDLPHSSASPRLDLQCSPVHTEMPGTICVCTYVCVCACVRGCACVFVRACVHACMHVRTRMCECEHVGKPFFCKGLVTICKNLPTLSPSNPNPWTNPPGPQT